MEAVRAMRYQDAGYFFISDMQARMLMHPLKPELIARISPACKTKPARPSSRNLPRP